METANVNPVEESVGQGLGPGGRLQAARIQLGMSIGDVANQMHLSSAILEALEENNFDEITAPIFVKGYLRAFARIVSLDEDSIIDEYVELYSNEDPPITTTSNTAAEISASDARIKWMTWLVILVLIALLGAWWWSQEQTAQEVISLDAEQPTAPQLLENVEVEETQEPTQQVTDGVAIQPLSEETVQSAEANSENDELPLLSLQPDSEPVPETNEDSTDAVAQTTQASDTGPISIQTAAVPGTVQRQAPDGNDEFRLVVNADTWADIKDANGFQLIYDLMRADNTLVMTGTAPFVVFLGNAYGVDVEINGESLDISSFIRDDNTARFQTGG